MNNFDSYGICINCKGLGKDCWDHVRVVRVKGLNRELRTMTRKGPIKKEKDPWESIILLFLCIIIPTIFGLTIAIMGQV